MGQKVQIIMGQIVHHYCLTVGGPGPVNAQIAQKRGDFLSPLFSGFRNAHAEISDRHP
jgi:hypothetical protein